jgi:DNA-binding beta-propeller fold protein YncE
MRDRRLLLAVLALFALATLASCSSRERSNPLDSQNPRSGGAPEGFNAIAGFVSARIVWSPRPDLAIDGFRLYRKAPFDNDYLPLGSLFPPTSGAYFDGGLSDGLDYRYRLYYVIQGTNSTRYAEDVVTAGRVRAWTTDPAGGRLIQLAPDARDIVQVRDGYGENYSIAVTPDLGPLWMSEDFTGKVRVRDPQLFTGPDITGFANRPFTIALDPQDHTAWVCDLDGKVVHLTPLGLSAGPSLTLLNQPSGVATDAENGDVWVTDLAGNLVRHYQRDSTPVGARPIASPSRVAVDSLTHEAWVTSFTSGWVWRVRADMVVLDSLRLDGPIGLALDWRRRTAWIGDARGNELVGIDMDTRAVRFRVAGLGDPRDAAVDLDRGEGWVVGRTAGMIYRFSPTGTLLGSVGGLGNPHEVRLDRGYQ